MFQHTFNVLASRQAKLCNSVLVRSPPYLRHSPVAACPRSLPKSVLRTKQPHIYQRNKSTLFIKHGTSRPPPPPSTPPQRYYGHSYRAQRSVRRNLAVQDHGAHNSGLFTSPSKLPFTSPSPSTSTPNIPLHSKTYTSRIPTTSSRHNIELPQTLAANILISRAYRPTSGLRSYHAATPPSV